MFVNHLFQKEDIFVQREPNEDIFSTVGLNVILMRTSLVALSIRNCNVFLLLIPSIVCSGAHSPSSFGSAKENVPEICNTVPAKFEQKGWSSLWSSRKIIYFPVAVVMNKRRRSLKNPVLKTNTVV